MRVLKLHPVPDTLLQEVQETMSQASSLLGTLSQLGRRCDFKELVRRLDAATRKCNRILWPDTVVQYANKKDKEPECQPTKP